MGRATIGIGELIVLLINAATLLKNDGVDLFFSFVTNASHSHVDIEDVFLIGLSGKTIYRLIKEKRDYLIEKGDLLYIPKGTAHKAISLTPRIIASVGLLGGKNYD